MSRSRARLAADWFAKLRENAVTQEVEHTDVVAAETEALEAKADAAAVGIIVGPTGATGPAGPAGSPIVAAGAVGSYAYMIVTTANIGANPSNTRAGSGLRYSAQSTGNNASGSGYSVGHTHPTAGAGTWQAMGGRTASTSYAYFATLWLRIS